MEIGTRLDLVDQQSRLMDKIVTDNVPETISSVVSAGATGWRANAISRAEMSLSLRPAAARKRSNTEIADAPRTRLTDRIAGMRIRTRAPQGQFLLERLLGGDEGLTIEVRGFDLRKIEELAGRVAASIGEVPGITDVEASNLAGIPQQEISIDRAKIADLGLTVRDVTKVIETAVAGARAGEFRVQGNSYRIFVQLKNVDQLSLDEILNLMLSTASGELVAIRNLVTTEAGRGPILIDRKDQQRLVTVRANVAGRNLGSVAGDVQARLDEIARPMGYDLTVSGQFAEQRKAFHELAISLALALLLVYMVLACQYESLRAPVVVMISVPVATIGVLLILFLTNTTREPGWASASPSRSCAVSAPGSIWSRSGRRNCRPPSPSLNCAASPRRCWRKRNYLGNRADRGLDLAARVSRRQAAAAIANLEQLIELDVWLAINEFERARQQIAATQATHYLQEETLKAEKERFDVGAGTALLVAQAQRDLLLSAIDEIEAVINCRRALVKLYVAEGSLLERRGVRLAGP
jgi:hypothetical protein